MKTYLSNSFFSMSLLFATALALAAEENAFKIPIALGNYSRFVRPGMVRVKCDTIPAQSIEDGVLASAYQGAEGHLVVVLLNLSWDKKTCDLDRSQTVDVYTTSQKENLGII